MKNDYLEKAKQIVIQLSEKSEEAKKLAESKKAEDDEKKAEEEKKLAEKKAARQKEFAEYAEQAFSEYKKGLEDRMCALEEGLKAVVAMSEKIVANKNKEKE